jgi:hypothetical protein
MVYNTEDYGVVGICSHLRMGTDSVSERPCFSEYQTRDKIKRTVISNFF